MWAQWNSGDREVRDYQIDPEVEIHSALTQAVYRGHEGAQRWIREIDEQFSDWRLELDSVDEPREGVVVARGAISMRGRHSGLDLRQPASWLVELRDGRPARASELRRSGRGRIGGARAMTGADGRILDRFARLCEIASPTGDERAVADAVAGELRDLGVEVAEDDSAGPARAGAGNLIARVPGAGEGWIAFFAHLDTVPHPEPIEVELADGVFRSRGETILGADNKAAVTVLAELAARHVRSPAPVGLELVFTVAEEDGLRGAKEVDLGALRSPFGFVLDHASPIGEVITAAPTYQRLQATSRGRRHTPGSGPRTAGRRSSPPRPRSTR